MSFQKAVSTLFAKQFFTVTSFLAVGILDQ